MPSKLPWSKSNRSHSSVDTSSGHPSPVPSVNNEAPPPPPPHAQQPSLQQQQIPPGVASPAFRQQQQQQQQFPQRTTSHRHSATIDQPPQNIPPGQPSAQQASPGIDHRRGSYQPQTTVYVQREEPQKKSLRSRIAAGLTGHSKDEEPRGKPSNNGLGRRVSVRKSDGVPPGYQPPSENRLQPGQQWAQRAGSSSHLPASDEHDEDDLDPFLQQEDRDNTPQPPPKDSPYQQHQQQFVPNPHQEQYRPPLARVNTEGSYNTQGGVDRYSPEQHQGVQQQQQPQQQHYQSYSPPAQHPQNPNEYQAFTPGSAPSPHPSNPQLQQQDLAHQQQTYYQYQQQQQQAPPQQQQSPQDAHQQSIHYQQQQQHQFPPPPQPHQGQDFQQQQPQHGRPLSQHQNELPNQQASRQIPQIVQQGQQIDTQHVQHLRPPSSHQQLAPPSPLQQQNSQFQAYDEQEGPPAQPLETHSQNTTPPQQAPENMAPPSGRNTLRKVNEAGQPQSGAPSRESSLLQQPPAQGQTQGLPQPPVSPGIPSFGANVVPAASQGQPYRGEQQPQQGQGGEKGRATPPPKSASTMTDDQINEMIKEHEVLREKYQKVKRYFFEQQSQVHQLQNTLAHQRLSLSRTSWDDSEYSTRFNRLDGLIAQMSFAIRKDWKSIPPWLQPVVNKNAVETGKQEMTAVGRAFISSWLVDNIFDKYFHPDLEHGLSTQLKLIQLNIRRFSPAVQSAEDEDALVAKVINWRLATLEGLAELLRSPHCQTNRQNLIDSLNEQLIGSLQMFLNDPAPPDLNGGVPMIVELAVNVAQHLPLESREVHIEYFPPGHSIVSEFMKMESGIPALTTPILDTDDAASLRSVASKVDDTASIPDQEQQGGQTSNADKKRSIFGLASSAKKPGQNPANLGKRESSLGQPGNLGQGGSQQSLTQPPPGSSSGAKDETPPPRVRLSVGVAVQIRGKSILIKAPVYST